MSTETTEAAQERYEKACHAMQSGVAMTMNYDRVETTPKHLRVGVNSALVSLRAMCDLLMAKGVFTEREYFTTLADAMGQEAKMYEASLSRHFGTEITLE